MKKYFTGILIYVVLSQLGPIISQFGKLNSLNGAHKVLQRHRKGGYNESVKRTYTEKRIPPMRDLAISSGK
jgi:hypothetical protein